MVELLCLRVSPPNIWFTDADHVSAKGCKGEELGVFLDWRMEPAIDVLVYVSEVGRGT